MAFSTWGWDVPVGNVGLGPNVGMLPAPLLEMLDTEVLRATINGDVATEVSVTRAGSLISVGDDSAVAVRVGLDFLSMVTPTKPIMRDYKDRPVLLARSLQKLPCAHGKFRAVHRGTGLHRRNSRRERRAGHTAVESDYLQLGKPPAAGRATNVVPCRSRPADMHTRIETKSVYELNVVQLDYVTSTTRKLQRS